jgi:tetratricopeptide (TPR) repeat protein
MAFVRNVAVLVCLLLGGCAGVVRSVPDGRRLDEAQRAAWAQAAGSLDRGRPEEAIEAVAPLLALEPWHVPSHVVYQDALRGLGREDELLAAYAPVAADGSDASRVLLAHRALPAQGGARETGYRRAVALDPQAAWPRLALAYELARRGTQALDEQERLTREGFSVPAEEAGTRGTASLEEAEALALAVAADHPRLAAAHGAVSDVVARAHSLGRRQARQAQAFEAAQRAVDLDPADPRAQVRLANAARRSSDDDTAADALQEAVALSGGDAGIRALFGRVLLDLRRDAEARRQLERAADALPDDMAILVNLGVALYRLEEFADAVELYEFAYQRAPDDPRPLEGLALACARLGDHDRAADAMRLYLQRGGTSRQSGREFIERMEGGSGSEPVPPEDR